MYESFKAVAVCHAYGFTVEVTLANFVTGKVMRICTEDGPIYITKEQAMKFFGLVEG